MRVWIIKLPALAKSRGECNQNVKSGATNRIKNSSSSGGGGVRIRRYRIKESVERAGEKRGKSQGEVLEREMAIKTNIKKVAEAIEANRNVKWELGDNSRVSQGEATHTRHISCQIKR